MKAEIFGTIFKPNARWQCGCGTNNVTQLNVPIRRVEHLFCKSCHRRSTIQIRVNENQNQSEGAKL